jgi:hypothetical protein
MKERREESRRLEKERTSTDGADEREKGTIIAAAR